MLVVKNEEKKNKILEVTSYSDYIKGKEYFPPFIEFRDKQKGNNFTINRFYVESERTTRLYLCNILVDKNNKVIEKHCDCPKFREDNSCKHISACLYNYYDDIFPKIKTEEATEEITNLIFSLFKNDQPIDQKRYVKEEVKLEIHLSGINNDPYYENAIELSLKVGTNRLYNCSNRKISNFLEAIEKKQEFYFGKNFSYHPDKNYFSKENQKIIDYLNSIKNQNNYRYQDFSFIGINSIKGLFNTLKTHKFFLNNKKILEINNTFPITTNLILENNKYKLKLNIKDSINVITNDFSYIQIDNILYHLEDKNRLLVSAIFSNDLDEFIFDKNKKDNFVNDILPVIKNKIEIDDEIKDIKVSKEIIPKLYFDLYYDKVICNLKFAYDDTLLDYFEDNENIVRDKTIENKVVDHLYQYNFKIDKNKILLDDIDNIGNFLDNDLEEITNYYETYTSEKLKEITVFKNKKVSSTFSIGKDNIMKYSFDLGDIKENEIVNIFESLKSKKKYYRLKSGDLLNLEENKELKELEALASEMEIGKKELEQGFGEIPKYRAIYLDSLKDEKYHIIKTDNLFKELIDRFNQYKNSNIKLSQKEKKILRPYQIEGIKWLYNIDKTGFGGILADEMGLGKSIQTIYYIKEMLKENKDSKFLIVSPTSLAYNWENEFEKFEPNMKYKVVAGLRDSRRKIFDELEKYNILITTYGLLREDKNFYEKIDFKTIIIDEAQNIKNPTTGISKTVKELKADTKFALTGTPIENSIAELWSIFDFIMPGFLSNLKSFEKKYKVKDFDEDSKSRLSNLNKLIHPFILRRRKKDVIKDLPNKIENNIYIDLTREQKKIYLAELEKVGKEMDEILMTEGISKARFLILKLLTKLRQICIDPRILFEDYTGGSGKMEEFVKVVKESVENGHKILVFTSFKTALEIARKELSNNHISSYTIAGDTSAKKRIDLVDQFNSDDTNVFFLMLQAGGTGLNLTSADVVIHLDLWWNPQAENQATDRAHRIGQKNVVEVIKFISNGTIEEKILDLQQKKKLLSDTLIDEDTNNQTFDKLTEEDIKNLLAYDNKDS